MHCKGYLSGLSPHLFNIYSKKLTDFDIVDPYEIPFTDCEENTDKWPEVEHGDIVNYLVFSTHTITHKQMKAYKSLDAHNYYSSGWVNNCVHVKKALSNDRVLMLGRQVFIQLKIVECAVDIMGSKVRGLEQSSYRDQQFKGSRNGLEQLLHKSCTLYVGNLSFYTTDLQIYELFSKCGVVKKVIVGLDRFKRTPCGFCFVEYYTREDAEDAMRYVNGTKLDDRIIRTDWDAGFVEGRQYGRGRTGGQVRDEYRTDYDSGRGGYGKIVQQKSVPLEPTDE